jgi:(R,R)-butanediol dehydrogenase/meso-butanediol dehydrogenase/diacetyl reductase/L-iditol 2-dehydrogenase
MKKAVVVKERTIAIQEIPQPRIRDEDDIKIRVHYVGICADDLFVFNNPGREGMGHEFSGVIVDSGPEAAKMGFTEGKPVTGFSWLFCGKCPYCRNGRENLCVNLNSQSAMVEYLVIKDRQAWILPGDVPLIAACLAELLASCMHGIDRVNIRPGQTVLILGAGGAGLVMLQLAKLQGAVCLTVSEPVKSKRLIARQLGADYVIDPEKDNLVMQAMEITNGLGYNSIIDASHNRDAVQQAAKLLSKGSSFLIFSLYHIQDQVTLNLSALYEKECNILTSYMAPYMLPRAIELLPRLNLDALIGACFPFDQIQQGFEAVGRYPRVIIQMAE